MSILKKLLKILGVVVFSVVLAGLVLNLFFESTYNNAKDTITGLFEEDVEQVSQDELTIIEPLPLQTFDPTNFDASTRQRLNNVYESLIRPDRDLNIKPALAISWGLLDDTTWEFTLRKDVEFHDGSTLDTIDVIESIDRARTLETSQLQDLLSTIKEVRRVDARTIEIETRKPDPLLLQKLATVYVLPDDWDGQTPVGTGPYKVFEFEPGEELILKRYADYWDDLPRFKDVSYLTISNSEQRLSALVEGEGDILDYVPFDLIESIDLDEIELSSVPSLEVQFLVFNFKSHLFRNLNARVAVKKAIDQHGFAEFVGGDYAHGVGQFVSSGVFGYNPDVENISYDLEEAGQLVEDSGLSDTQVTIALPMGLDVLGEYLTLSLEEIGLVADIQYVQSEYLIDVLQKMNFDMYFIGFKSELGDAGDFLASLVHTREQKDDDSYGQFNFSHYSNEEVDEYIEAIEVAMNPEERLLLMQEVMKFLAEGDVFGVPLFEYETVFASKKDLNFEPRIDGFIYLKDL